jgi:hypothetical protein
MRWLAVLLVLVVASEASARVVMRPPVERLCSRGKTWPEVSACLAKHGAVKLIRSITGARLVSVTEMQDRKLGHEAMYLYIQSNAEWKLGANLNRGFGDFDILALERLVIGKHSGFRIDVGQAWRSTVLLDKVYPVAATYRLKRSLFCGGDGFGCPSITTACEVLVHGKAMFAFRGAMTIEDGAVLVSGDRSKAGQCAPPEKMALGWTQP